MGGFGVSISPSLEKRGQGRFSDKCLLVCELISIYGYCTVPTASSLHSVNPSVGVTVTVRVDASTVVSVSASVSTNEITSGPFESLSVNVWLVVPLSVPMVAEMLTVVPEGSQFMFSSPSVNVKAWEEPFVIVNGVDGEISQYTGFPEKTSLKDTQIVLLVRQLATEQPGPSQTPFAPS